MKKYSSESLTKFSIIIPTLNSELFIEETLDSIVQQGTDYVIEVVIVDGGSIDRTLEIVNGFQTVLNIVILTQSGSGLYSAINQGLNSSKGEIVGYLNSDDWLEADALRLIETEMQKSESTLVFGDLNYVDSESKRIARINFPKFSARNFQCCNFSLIGQPGTFWRRIAHSRVGVFNEDFRLAGDFEFFARFQTIYPVTKISAVLANYRVHRGSLSARNPDLAKLEVEEIKRRFFNVRFGSVEFGCRRFYARLKFFGFNIIALLKLRKYRYTAQCYL
jgi:glycosyltransferase involved in cell wall biosynthesis